MGSDEDYVYQLRRTGAAATYPHIKDVMKLKMGVTRFGRSTDNDYYLDSAKLKNFISRSHAEIHAKKSEDGQYVFVLHNKGLNGTFINDIKMNQFILLQEGDKITFGHTNGFKLEPGQRANQPNSEFEFVFEKVPARFAEADSTSEVRDGKILSSPESDHKKSPKSPKSPSKLKRQSDINSYLSKHSKDSDKTEIKFHNSPRNSMSPDHRSYDLSSPDAKYSEQSMSPLIPQPPRDMSPLIPQAPHESSTLVMSEEDIEDNHSEIKSESPDSKKKGKFFEKMFDFDDDSDNDEELKDLPVKSKGNKRGRKKKDPPIPDITKTKKTSPKRKVTISPKRQPERKLSSIDSDEEELPTPGSPSSLSHHSDDPFNFDDSDSDSNNKRNKKSTRGKSSGGRGRGGGGAGRGRGRGRRAKIPEPKIEIEYPDDDEDEEEEEKLPKKRKPVVVKSEQVKKKPRGRPSSGADNYSELEDGVEWYEEEKCSAEKCKRPKNKRVKWVQCDLCDEWYHTVCVGCQYEHVKDNNIEFSCGYCN